MQLVGQDVVAEAIMETMIESKAMEPQMSVDKSGGKGGSGVEHPHAVAGGGHQGASKATWRVISRWAGKASLRGVGGQPLGGLQHPADEGLVAGVGEGDFEVGVGLGKPARLRRVTWR